VEEEGALALLGIGQGDGGELVVENLADAFVVGEEEGLVFEDGAAEGGAELVTDELGLGVGDGFDGANCVEDGVAEVVPGLAVELVGAAAGGDVDDAAGLAAVLGGVVAGFETELGDGVGRRRDVLVFKALVGGSVVGVFEAVEEELVEGRALAVDVVRAFAAGGGLVF
jgi:hypothetical protein